MLLLGEDSGKDGDPGGTAVGVFALFGDEFDGSGCG